MPDSKPTRVVILGGGFGGVYTTTHLEQLWKHHRDRVHVTLVSRDNFFTMTPLLFEAGSGVLEPRHAVSPIRPMLRWAEFIEAEVLSIDLHARQVMVQLEGAEARGLEYDHLVLALGGVTNTSMIRGCVEHAMTFKTLGDAISLRNHVIQRFEHADVEPDPARKRAALTFVIIGAGFVGVELQGELTEFVKNVARVYRNVGRDEIQFELIEGGPRIMPEFEQSMADYAAKILRGRGVTIRTNTKVTSLESGKVMLDDDSAIVAHTIVLATGVTPSPILSTLPVGRSRKGAVVVDACMRVPDRPGVWALGDCASIPAPDGRPYPPLAQHALREARVLASNITATIRGDQRGVKPFEYTTIGLLAGLGNFKGVGRIKRLRFRGFVAWWVWRSYYLFQMPRWPRRLRVMVDWTVALFFRNDIVQLDMLQKRKLRAEEARRSGDRT